VTNADYGMSAVKVKVLPTGIVPNVRTFCPADINIVNGVNIK